MDESRIPILVGCGQITQREADPGAAQSPIDLTAAARGKRWKILAPVAPC